MNIKKFTILGERCSGTTFLELAIDRNFDLEVTWQYGWKHFFGFDNLSNSDDCLFISIIRNPMDWINSFYNHQHHLCSKFKGDPIAFLNDPIFSVYDSGKGKQGRDMIEDYHIHEKRRYHNIFELREIKANYQKNIMPDLVKNHVFLKYEDLRDDYDETLLNIEKDFKLKRNQKEFQTITTYMRSNLPYPQYSGKTFTAIDIINKINKAFEKNLGYDVI